MIQILVVEDNPGDVELLRMALLRAELECELTVIADGQKALAHVLALDGNGPDLLILDLNLPKNDGLEILQAIRSSDRVRDMPVLVLTSSASPFDAARVEQLGAARRVTKPMDLEDFMEVGRIVKSVLDGSGQD